MAKVKKKKAKAEGSNSDGNVYRLRATIPPAPTYLFGHVKVEGDEVRINMKKRRSKKRIERVFNVDQLLGYCAASEEDGGYVIANTSTDIVDDRFTDVAIDANGTISAVNEAGMRCVFFAGPGKLDINCSYESD